VSYPWPTNDELRSVHSELRDAVLSVGLFGGLHIIPLSEANYENAIANDPAAIDALFAYYSQAQSEIPLLDERTPFDEIDRELDGWNGDAASAFRTNLGNVQNFLNEQALYFEEMKGCINGAYLLSIEARQSYRSLAEETTNALRAYEAEDDSTFLVIISVVAGVVLGALSAGTTVVGAVFLGALAGGASVAAESARQPIGGADPSEIAASYVTALNELNRNLDEAGAALVEAFEKVTEKVVNESTNISRSLPVVDSYEDFHSPFRPAGGEFDAQVQLELERWRGRWIEQEHGKIRQALG